MENVNDLEYVEAKAKELKTESNHLKDFLTYGYLKKHLQLNSGPAIHCCCYALNESETCANYSHSQTSQDCGHCANVASFFAKKFTSLISRIKKDLTATSGISEALTKELGTMVAATPDMTDHVMKFMGHKACAFAQFHEIKQLYENLEDDEIMITIDHKQKTLTMKHREGQVEYFGKVGMSLLGAIMARPTLREYKAQAL
eukprot:11776764-Ditylum_brightwellii.AAC.2